MAQNMNDPDFKAKCALIWPAYANNTTIDRFYEAIAVHQKSVFLGYLDITLGLILQGGHVAKWKLRGIQVKLLGGKAHLDMPSDESDDGKFFETYFPKTAEDRHIITTLVFSAPAIKQAVVNATRVIESMQPAAAAPAANPAELPASVDAGVPAEGSVGALVDNPFSDDVETA